MSGGGGGPIIIQNAPIETTPKACQLVIQRTPTTPTDLVAALAAIAATPLPTRRQKWALCRALWRLWP